MNISRIKRWSFHWSSHFTQFPVILEWDLSRGKVAHELGIHFAAKVSRTLFKRHRWKTVPHTNFGIFRPYFVPSFLDGFYIIELVIRIFEYSFLFAFFGIWVTVMHNGPGVLLFKLANSDFVATIIFVNLFLQLPFLLIFSFFGIWNLFHWIHHLLHIFLKRICFIL